MALRWAIGCRSRKLRWGNVCLHDWTVPRVHVNWAPCNHPQAHIWSVCLQLCTGKKKAGGDYPRSWMFHFETVIEMDFCLPSFTLWQTPKSQSSKFSVPKWFMNRECMARRTAGGCDTFLWSEISWRDGPRLTKSCQQMLPLNLWDPFAGWLLVLIGRPQ